MEKEKDMGQETSGGQMMPAAPIGRSSSRLGAAGGEQPEAENFDNALTELKDLSSQLHQAADYCEKAFLNTKKKKLILESTKSYICDAIVAVIDHLGAISSKVEHQLHDNTEIAQTEHKINFLKQRLLTCEQYAITLHLSTIRGNAKTERHHQHYRSKLTQGIEVQNGDKSRFNNIYIPNLVVFHLIVGYIMSFVASVFVCREENTKNIEVVGPAISSASLKPHSIQLRSGKEDAMVDPSSISARRSFVFKAEDADITGGGHKKKATHGINILSFLRRSTRRS